MAIEKQTVFEKTPKGINESQGRWGLFLNKTQKVLALIDGKQTVEELISASGMKEAKLLAELETLLQDRLIRESWEPAGQFTVADTPYAPHDIHVTVANTQAFMEALQKQKTEEKDEDDLISLDDIEEKLRLEAEQLAKREEAERQFQIEAKVREDAERRSRENAEQKAREAAEQKAAEEEARRAREETERQAKEAAERRAHEEEQRRAREEAERKARMEEEQKARAEEERLARAEAERKAKEAAEQRAREEEERRAREEAERKAKEDAERKAREERIAKRLKAREEEERRAREEAERQAREAAERQVREEEERRAREEAERQAKEAAERQAREEEERRAREEAERQAKEAAERKVREEEERRAREEAERQAREAAERQAREEEERRAREEAERQAKEAAERQAREEEERRAREEAERQAREAAERQAREEEERRAREEAERQAREAAERQAREEEERRAREEAERQTREAAERQAREEEERRAREEAERQTREAAERQAREEEERRAREEAERQAKEAAERKAREEEDERQAREAERLAREAAERKASEAEEQRARAEAENQAREESERQAKEEKKQRAREDAEHKAREKAEQKARAEAEKQAKLEARRIAREAAVPGQAMDKLLPWIKWGVAGLLGLIAIAVAAIHFVPLDSARKELENLASTSLGEAVKIDTLHVSLFPSPYLKLGQIQVGSQGNLRIANARIHAGWGTLFGSGREIERIELEKVEPAAGMLEAAIGWPASNARQTSGYRVAQVTLRNLNIGEVPFRGEFNFAADGGMEKSWLGSEDGAVRAEFSPSPGGLVVSASLRDVAPLSVLPLKIDALQASGMISGKKLHFAELSGTSHGGKLSGNLMLSWDQDWSAAGEVRIAEARVPLPAKASDKLQVSGRVDASLNFLQKAEKPELLLRQPLLSGSVTLREGAVSGFDLPAALHYEVEAIYSGQTGFENWSFKLEPVGEKQGIRAMKMAGKGLLIEGSADVSRAGEISGAVKLQVEGKKKITRGNYRLGGTLDRPIINRIP